MAGLLYLMEVNARGGDPETPFQLPRISGVAFHELLLAFCQGDRRILEQVRVDIDNVWVGVVMASKGYPQTYQKGSPIHFPKTLPAPGRIIPMGLACEDNILYNAGGRVALIIGEGQTVAEARVHAYANVESVRHGDALVYRDDIGLV
jgi:phosphoribosylamine--glycine ligase